MPSFGDTAPPAVVVAAFFASLEEYRGVGDRCRRMWLVALHFFVKFEFSNGSKRNLEDRFQIWHSREWTVSGKREREREGKEMVRK